MDTQLNAKEDLIEELRACAELLTNIASSEDVEKTASSDTISASSERRDYVLGVLEGLGIN